MKRKRTGNPIITLLTDFGNDDPYVAAMKGVIVSHNRDVQIIDISHSIQAHDIIAAGFVLNTTYTYFPKGTIHLSVVDPGVGSGRKIIVLQAHGHIFIAPDNGVLTYVYKNASIREVREITNAVYFQKDVSNTFHGRDIMAPIAAHISQGVSLSKLGRKQKTIKTVVIHEPQNTASGIKGHVMYSDHFGNIVTNIPGKMIRKKKKIEICIRGRKIRGPYLTYAGIKNKACGVLIGSHGFMEIAKRCSSAAKYLKVKKYETLLVR